MITIMSLQHPLVKHLVKIREEKKFREEHRSILISGYKLIKEIAAHMAPLKLFIVKAEDEEFASQSTQIFRVSQAVIKKITGLPSPEPIAAEFTLPMPTSLRNRSPVLVLDAIQDPGNLGTLLRTALALGWEGVFFLPNCVDPFHEKVIRSSRAALFNIPWYAGTWEELAEMKHDGQFKIYIADIKGQTIANVAPEKKIMLLLSNEGHGLDQRSKNLGDRVTIEMKGNMESLNVAVAGAILMYQLKK